MVILLESGEVLIISRKIKLTILNEDDNLRVEQYKFIRDSQYSQYIGLNRCMGYIMSGYYSNNMSIDSEEFKSYKKTISNSLFIFDDIIFGKGIDSKSLIIQKVKKDFLMSIKNGLGNGERSSTNYKRTFPLMIRGRDLKFKYDIDEKNILISWVNKITFKCIFGESKNTLDLRQTLCKVINNDYKISQSSLGFGRNNTLILNLTLDIPNKNKNEFIKERVCGVCLGIKVPVYCCLSDDIFKKLDLGTYKEFYKVREQFTSRRKRIENQIKSCKGSEGRIYKSKALNQLRDKESNFAKTYNNYLAENIVKFSKINKCEFINMSNLYREDSKFYLLDVWSYYQLQEQIKYKAERVGIKVRFVSTYQLYQTCSKCGNIDKENKKIQEQFVCTKCKFSLNSDYNSSINIARSKEFIK